MSSSDQLRSKTLNYFNSLQNKENAGARQSMSLFGKVTKAPIRNPCKKSTKVHNPHNKKNINSNNTSEKYMRTKVNNRLER